jgi:hypothetical protein
MRPSLCGKIHKSSGIKGKQLNALQSHHRTNCVQRQYNLQQGYGRHSPARRHITVRP